MRTTAITIRSASVTDAEAVFDMAADLATSFKVEHRVFKASFLQAIAQPGTFLRIAEDTHTPIAYLLGFAHLSFFAGGKVAGMEELYVAPDHRGKGCGKCLVKDFERWAEEQGCRLCFASTRRAEGFYESSGYEASASYMRKLLSPPRTRYNT